jgi:hypothetical protein
LEAGARGSTPDTRPAGGAWRTFVRGWKAFWIRVAWTQAIVLLLLIYFIPLGLTSVICRLLRRDFLRARTRGKETFWLSRPPADTSLSRAERQF